MDELASASGAKASGPVNNLLATFAASGLADVTAFTASSPAITVEQQNLQTQATNPSEGADDGLPILPIAMGALGVVLVALLVGGVIWRARRSGRSGRSDPYTAPPTVDKVLERGDYGKKTGPTNLAVVEATAETGRNTTEGELSENDVMGASTLGREVVVRQSGHETEFDDGASLESKGQPTQINAISGSGSKSKPTQLRKKNNNLPPLKLTTAAERQIALAEANETKGEAKLWMPSEEKSNVKVVTNITFKFEVEASNTDDKVETGSAKQLALVDEDDSSDEEVFL